MNASTTNISQKRSSTPGTLRRRSDVSIVASTSPRKTLSPSEGAESNPPSSSERAFLISLNSNRRFPGNVKSLHAQPILPFR